MTLRGRDRRRGEGHPHSGRRCCAFPGRLQVQPVICDGEKFGLIDVEYFVQAEPSLDLGKYCGHLAPSMPEHWSDSARANEARRTLLDAYRRVRPEYRGTRFALYEALSLATRALVVMWSQRNALYRNALDSMNRVAPPSSSG